MEQVTLPLVCVNSFDLPPVCVVTGSREGITWLRTRVRTVGLETRSRRERPLVELPWCQEAYRRWHRLRRLGQIGAGICCVMVLVGILLVAYPGWVGGLAVIFAPPVILTICGAMAGYGWAPRVTTVGDTHVALRVRSPEFVAAVRTTLPAAGGAPGQVVRGYASPPGGASCAHHPGTDAEFLCGRCGDFLCRPCGRWVPVADSVLCETCSGRRMEHLARLGVSDPTWACYGKPPPRNHLAPVALWCGVLGLIPPMAICSVPAVICGVLGLAQARRTGVGRAASIWGLVLGLLGIAVFLALTILL